MDKGIIVHTAIVNEAGQVLIIRRQPNDRVLAGFWDIPGGTLEDGEDPVAGATRETLEETGLTIDHLEIFHSISNVDTRKNKQFVRLIFRAQTNGGDIRLNPDEHAEYRWIDPSAPPELLYVDYLPDCLRKLASTQT